MMEEISCDGTESGVVLLNRARGLDGLDNLDTYRQQASLTDRRSDNEAMLGETVNLSYLTEV